MTIGERIRERRKALGYTQKQLGKLCGGMADSAIRKYESGKITPKRSTLVKIAHALQVPLWALSDDDLEIDTDGSGGGNMKKVFRMAYKMVWHSCEEEVPHIPVGPVFKLYLVTDKDGDIDIAHWHGKRFVSRGGIVHEDDVVGWADIPRPHFVEEV